MIKKLLLTFILFLAFKAYSQETSQTEIPLFDKIEVIGQYKVDIKKGEKNSIKFYGSSEDVSNVRFAVKNNTLKISSLKKILEKGNSVRIVVTFTSLNKILVTAGGSIYCSEVLSLDSIDITCGSGSSVDIKIEINSFSANVDKGSTISISGSCKKMDIEAASGGIFDAYELVCDTAIVRANSGGLAKVYVKKYLNAAAAAGGEISYRGSPTKLIPKKTLGGKIEMMSE